MLGRENTGSALGSGAVDADFWALVCEDEEWLDAEFDAIVSEAGETPARSRRRCSTGTDLNGRAMRGRRPPEITRPWRVGHRRGGRWRRQRGPPGRVTIKAVFRRLKIGPLVTGDSEGW